MCTTDEFNGTLDTLKRDVTGSLKIFLDGSNVTYVHKTEAGIIGFIVVRPEGPLSPYIQSVAVHGKYRGRGIGSQMISEVEEIYSTVSRHIFICVSSFNEKAKKLYERIGFKVTAELPDHIIEGYSEWLLIKALKNEQSLPIPFISSRKEHMDIDFIYEQLKRSYWATEVTREEVIARVMNSICFGVFINNRQIGFARVITDYSSFAYLADVLIEEKERGKGYSKELMDYIINFPPLLKKKWLLATRDAHGLYKKFGFTAIANPERFMGKDGWRAFGDVNRES